MNARAKSSAMKRVVYFDDGPAVGGKATIYKPAGQPWPNVMNVQVYATRKNDPGGERVPLIAAYQAHSPSRWRFVGFVEAKALPQTEAMMTIDPVAKTVSITTREGVTTEPVPFTPDELAPTLSAMDRAAKLASHAVLRGWGKNRHGKV